MEDFIKISKCKKFFISETKIYSLELDMSFPISDLGLDFWIHLMKENSIALVNENTKNLGKVYRILNEFVFGLSDKLNDTKLLIEYHRTNKNFLLAEGLTFEGYKNIIENSWDSISKYLYSTGILNEEESWWDKTKKIGSQVVSGVKQLGSKILDKGKKVAGKIVDANKKLVNWVKGTAMPWFFESLRAALHSWGGAAITTFLASAGSLAYGLGPTINFIVWAAMLCYDLYLGISEGKWDYVNIIIDLFGTFTAGPGGKAAQLVFKNLGLLGSALKGQLPKLIQKLTTSKAGSTLVNTLNSIVKGLSTLLSYVGQAIKWIGEKLGYKKIVSAGSRIKTEVSKIVTSLSEGFAKSKTATIVQGGKKLVSQGLNTIKTKGKNLLNKFSSLPTAVKAGVQGAAVGGAVYGLNKATGGDTRVLAGAWSDDFKTEAEKQTAQYEKLLSSDNVEVPPEDLLNT